MDRRRRVVITGTGAVSPVGNTAEELWAALLQGTSGIGPITRFDASGMDSRFACEVKDFTTEGVLDRKDSKRMGVAREVAEVVRFLAGDGAGYITGQTIHVNGGLYM